RLVVRRRAARGPRRPGRRHRGAAPPAAARPGERARSLRVRGGGRCAGRRVRGRAARLHRLAAPPLPRRRGGRRALVRRFESHDAGVGARSGPWLRLGRPCRWRPQQGPRPRRARRRRAPRALGRRHRRCRGRGGGRVCHHGCAGRHRGVDGGGGGRRRRVGPARRRRAPVARLRVVRLVPRLHRAGRRLLTARAGAPGRRRWAARPGGPPLMSTIDRPVAVAVPRRAPRLAPARVRRPGALAGPEPGRRTAPIAVRPVPASTRRTRAVGAQESFVLLLGLVGLLTVIGLVMVLSASSGEAALQGTSPWVYFERQVLWVAVGTIALATCAAIDYRRWRRFAMPLLLAVVGMLVAVCVPGIGIVVSGSRRWLGFGQWQFQPSELAKFAMTFFAADLLVRRADRMHDTR